MIINVFIPKGRYNLRIHVIIRGELESVVKDAEKDIVYIASANIKEDGLCIYYQINASEDVLRSLELPFDATLFLPTTKHRQGD
jgi:hypothetical protein